MKHFISKQSDTAKLLDTSEQILKTHKQQLAEYRNLLIEWNKRINLISRDVSRETIWRHIRHSLLISTLKPFKNANLIVDAGTGGGLPGIPLAITHPSKKMGAK